MKRYTVKIDGKVSDHLSIYDDQDPKIQYAKKLGFADFAAWVAHMDATGWPEIEFVEIEPSKQGNTPVRSVRLSDNLWAEFQRRGGVGRLRDLLNQGVF